MSDGGKNERKAYQKLTSEERTRFLEVLRETGNRKFAAKAIGVDVRGMDQRREHDPELDREWEAAVEEAHRRLAQAKGPFDCPQGPGQRMIRRGKRGRLQLIARRGHGWNAEVEERFKAVLRATGNVRAAAAAVGFCENTIWQRRRKWPAFAQMLEEVLEDAEMDLELRLARMGSNVMGEGGGDAQSACGGPTPSPSLTGRGVESVAPVPFNMDAAMRFLKWREEKRRGGGRWAPRAKPPSIEEVTEAILKRVAAIKRHRQREAGE